MRYQKIESKIWHDEKFCALTATEQRLFFYILTSPHGNLLGLYVLKTGYVCEDLKCLPKDFKKDLAKLIEIGLMEYDESTSVVWVKNFLRYNPITNPNQRVSAKKLLLELPKTYLIQQVITSIEGLAEVLPKGLTEGLTEVLSKPETESEADTEVESEEIILSGEPDAVSEILNHMNSVLGTNYKATTRKTRELIHARLREGFAVKDFKTVIDRKAQQWKGNPKMSEYLRPITLFGTKFESYLNEPCKQIAHTTNGPHSGLSGKNYRDGLEDWPS